MNLLPRISSALKAILADDRPRQPQTVLSAMTTFPQFSNLPAELRLKIWNFALEPRHIHLDLAKIYPAWLGEENRHEGYAPDPDPDDDPSSTQPFDGLRVVPEIEDAGDRMYGYPNDTPETRPTHMTITPCTDSDPCHCTYRAPSSKHLKVIPALFSVSHESREAVVKQYIRCLQEEYDIRGRAVLHPCSDSEESLLKGIIINPSLDTLVLHTNVASRTSVQEVHHLAAILSQHLPEIRKVVISLRIAMPPYKHFSSARYHYWRDWGEDGWWVPMRFLVKLKGLREVVLVGAIEQKMLPLEWRTRTEGQWREEFWKVRERWPAEWEGRMPNLRFAECVEKA